MISEIEDRIARWTLLPAGNGEGLQVLRYGHDQKYDAHWDAFFNVSGGRVGFACPPPPARSSQSPPPPPHTHPTHTHTHPTHPLAQKEGIANGGNRYATVLMYLADVEEGGETAFPEVPAPGGSNGADFSDCAKKYLAAKPRKGDAVLFHSMKPNGELERRSLHTACPVIKGTKWSAAKWIHVGHYAMGGEEPVAIEQASGPLGLVGGGGAVLRGRPEAVWFGGDIPPPHTHARARFSLSLTSPPSPTPPPTLQHVEKVKRVDGCEDRNTLCDQWAMEGECERNKGFMIGTRNHPGECLLACDKCEMLHGGMEASVRHRKYGGT